MDSTSSRHIIYRGPVKNITSFIQISGLVWLLATLIVAKRFFRLRKHDGRHSFYHIFSFRPQTLVACLCFFELAHALLAHISSFITPDSLTFDSEDTATWPMKLTFLSTATTTLVCQSYIVHIGYQLWSRKKIFLYVTMPFVIIAFMHSVATILAGQAHLKWHTLEFYFGVVAVAAGISSICHAIMTLIMALYPLQLLPGNTNINLCRIFRLLGCVLAIYSLMISIPRLVHVLRVVKGLLRQFRANADGLQDGYIFWAYADIAGYEAIGNSYPVLIIWLMCMPGFGTWDEADDSTKMPLLQGV